MQRQLSIILYILLTCFSIQSNGGEFMGLFNKKTETVYPFSGFDGQLFYKGEPAAGAVITRIYNQMEEGEVEETTTADDHGYFQFKSISTEFKQPTLSSLSYLSRQKIIVNYKHENFRIWGGGKPDKREFSEFQGKPKNFTCELTEDRRTIDHGVSFIGTNCHWDIDKD